MPDFDILYIASEYRIVRIFDATDEEDADALFRAQAVLGFDSYERGDDVDTFDEIISIDEA